MALTTAQRNKLPKSAFVYHSGPRSNWKYPVPTKAQAKKAGISEKSRVKIHRAAKSYAARKSTSGTPAKVNAVVHKRGPLKPSGRRSGGSRRRR
jgi:hypothetical protein